MPHMLFVCECHVNIYYPKEVLMRLFFKPSMTKEKKYESHYSNTMWLSYIETLCVFFFFLFFHWSVRILLANFVH